MINQVETWEDEDDDGDDNSNNTKEIEKSDNESLMLLVLSKRSCDVDCLVTCLDEEAVVAVGVKKVALNMTADDDDDNHNNNNVSKFLYHMEIVFFIFESCTTA